LIERGVVAIAVGIAGLALDRLILSDHAARAMMPIGTLLGSLLPHFSMIVASGVGGGYGVYGRVLARYYCRYIPVNRTIVVQNMDAASGLEATNYVCNKAPRDGSVILATYNSLLTRLLFNDNSVLYDVLKMN